MQKRLLPRRAISAIGLILLFLFIGYFVYDYITNEPQAQAAKKVLEEEMSKISKPPDAIRLDRISTNKTQRAFVSETYATPSTFSDLRAFYNRELVRLGWMFAQETQHDNPGKNVGQRAVSYCKDKYTATLRYKGSTQSDDWTYAIDMGWWMQGCDPI